LARLRRRGLVVGVAGNTSVHTERMLRGLLPAQDIVTSSASLGAAKPSPAFFDGLVRVAGMRPSAIAYVGDRIDNDVAPAAAAGMVAVHVRPGARGHGSRPSSPPRPPRRFGSIRWRTYRPRSTRCGRRLQRCAP
jgi:FMN phosphatase YigB (HAD superfamily)